MVAPAGSRSGYTGAVKLRILGSYGGSAPGCRMTSFLLDEVVAVDAGSTTAALSIAEQRRVRHVLVSHSHMDHTASLPFLVENVFGAGDEAVVIYSTATVLRRLRTAIFNNDTWPDFTRIPSHLYPVVRFVEIEAERPFVLEGLPSGELEVTAVPVDHVVPTVGFLLRQGGRSLLFTSDTGPTERVWQVANAADDLAGVIVECSFPSRMREVAEVSLHLTPELLAAELGKLERDVPVWLYHLKPPYLDELRREIGATAFPHPVEELEQGATYEVGLPTTTRSEARSKASRSRTASSSGSSPADSSQR